ncbi:MAG: hypothetical protein QOG49_433, partial [Frankiaceae bacterium]|nr:hypothetical protein [Frankiaceae bacterium]
MTAQPHYIGSTDRAGFAMVHWPDSAVRGAAIICPPLAYEQVCAYRTLRILAERLAGLGIATLRIDYDGTGNSFGRADDPARVAAWRTSILAAISEARSFGFETVTLIGVRFGGTLAADVATRANGIDGVVLWDPIESGRRYARTLRLMSATGDATAAAPVVAVAGIVFTDETLTDIAASRFDATAL